MRRPAPQIVLNAEEKQTMLAWTRQAKGEQRLVHRARMVLLAATGLSGQAIAQRLETRPARISKWLNRFGKERLAGLRDAPRPGDKRRKYDRRSEKRILEALDEPPPKGFARWNGSLLAARLGDVSKDQVWRVMRRHHLYLDRRQSWCISTDPEFARKGADVVGIYLHPPEN